MFAIAELLYVSAIHILKKRIVDKKAIITALSAGDVIKNKNKNLRMSFENDEFYSLPDEYLLDEIDSLMEES